MRSAPAILVVTLGLAACAGGAGGESSSDAQAQEQRSFAVLFVERQIGDNAAASAHVGGRFVQFTGISAEALPDLLGIPSTPNQATGCSVHTDASVDTSGPRAEARLVDIGPIDVQSGDRTIRLEPRRFPDLWNVVSGVIYANDGETAGTDWHFSAAGNAQTGVGAFDTPVLHAPDDLTGVTLADQSLTPGGFVALPRRAFAVRWNRGDANDSVMISFESSAASGEPSNGTIVCSAPDSGLLAVDTAWGERIVDLVHAGAAVTVHRVRTHPFTATQLDNASVVFDVAMRGRVAGE